MPRRRKLNLRFNDIPLLRVYNKGMKETDRRREIEK